MPRVFSDYAGAAKGAKAICIISTDKARADFSGHNNNLQVTSTLHSLHAICSNLLRLDELEVSGNLERILKNASSGESQAGSNSNNLLLRYRSGKKV